MKHLKTFQLYEATQHTGRFNVLPNGNLEISLDGTEDMEELQKFQGDDDQFLWEFFEKELTNGFNLVNPDYKGLTEAPVISDSLIDSETTEDEMKHTKVWFYGDYMLHSVQEILIRDGKIVFTKHELNESLVTEASLPSNIADWLKHQGSEQSRAAKKVAGWVEKAGNRISGGTSIGKSPQTLILDIKYQGSEVYINADGEIEFLGEPVTSPKEFQKMLDVYKRSSPENKKYFKIQDEPAADATPIQ